MFKTWRLGICLQFCDALAGRQGTCPVSSLVQRSRWWSWSRADWIAHDLDKPLCGARAWTLVQPFHWGHSGALLSVVLGTGVLGARVAPISLCQQGAL